MVLVNQIFSEICVSLTSTDIPYGGHVRVHNFNRPISDVPTKSLGIKTESYCLYGQYN